MKYIFSILLALFITSVAFAQNPQKISYQAVVRDASNDLLTNGSVGMRISIRQNSASGTLVYRETHTATTNDNGLASIQIGGGNVQNGSMEAINWGDGPYFVVTEADPNGGTSYTITGSSQILSVPYAMYAEKTKSASISAIHYGQNALFIICIDLFSLFIPRHINF